VEQVVLMTLLLLHLVLEEVVGVLVQMEMVCLELETLEQLTLVVAVVVELHTDLDQEVDLVDQELL
jgi:hypothetical protein